MAEIGSTLRETRMRARIDISEVEAHTKIRAKYLRAIENEDWDLLPGPVFVKSFLKTYGDYLGLDSRPLIDEFKRRYEDPGELRPMAALSRERDRAARGPRRPPLPPAALIVIVLLLVGGALYLLGSSGNKSPQAGLTTPSRSHSGRRHHHPQGTGTITTGTTSTATSPVVTTTATLTLAPTTKPVWMCVETGSGKRLLEGIYSPGATIPTQKGAELLVTLGNADVAVTVNGKSYPLSATSTAIGLKITPTGAKPLTPGPTCA